MNAISTITRFLLAFVFVVFGLNGFLHFIPQPPPASELAKQYFTVMTTSHYLTAVFAIQLACGILFVFRQTVPLALTLIAPVIVNILLFHATMDPAGIVPGIVATALWMVVLWRFRAAFSGIVPFLTPTDTANESVAFSPVTVGV